MKSRLPKTRNDLPEKMRREMIKLLNQNLADILDLDGDIITHLDVLREVFRLSSKIGQAAQQNYNYHGEWNEFAPAALENLVSSYGLVCYERVAGILNGLRHGIEQDYFLKSQVGDTR